MNLSTAAAWLITIAMFPFIGSLAAQESVDPVAKLTSSYEQALNLANEPLKDLGNRYIEELGKLKVKAQKAGNLEMALKIESEIKEFNKSGERDFESAPDLLRLRKIFDDNLGPLELEVKSKQALILRQAIQKFDDLSKALTKQGDLSAAVRSKEMQKTVQQKLDALATSAAGAGDEEKFRATVDSTNNEVVPLATTVKLKKGQTFRIIPNERDEWGGGGSKTGVLCDFRGYPGEKSQWMRMFSKVGDGDPQPVDPEMIQTAAKDGILQLFAGDGSPAGNTGKIRVTILVNPKPIEEQ